MTTIRYYFKRIKELGLKKTSERLSYRIIDNIIHYQFKSRLALGRNTLSWQQFQALSYKKLTLHDFVAQPSSVKRLLSHPKFATFLHVEPIEKIIATADKTVAAEIGFFGKTHRFSNHSSFRWHDDFFTHTSPKPWYKKKHLPFYRDIGITWHKTEATADIKVPWELSRMNHLVSVAYAASLTNDEKHVNACHEQIESWLRENPYLVGVNWKCTMEVALRALNLLWIFHYLTEAEKNGTKTPESFLQKLIPSLYQHFEFILHNWELSDKPNNHYLADIVGALYLADFFKELPLARKHIKNIKHRFFEQFESQIFVEGTDYEGSTRYHQLVTELCTHALLIISPEKVTDTHWKKLEKMQQFNSIANHTPTPLNIGDNDSGKVLPHLNLAHHKNRKKIITYKEFGLSVITTPAVLLSLRHPVYNPRQPTGHFHGDHLSITLSINDTPFLVDPGSGVYTGNAALRNDLRGAHNHSTFYLTGRRTRKDLFLSDLSNLDLFQMPQVPQSFNGLISEHEEAISLYDCAELYQGIKLTRRVTINNSYQNITLCDALVGAHESTQAAWNFVLHPSVTVTQTEAYRFTLTNNKVRVTFTTPVPATLLPARYSPGYGEVLETEKINFTASLKTAQHALTLITWNL